MDNNLLVVLNLAGWCFAAWYYFKSLKLHKIATVQLEIIDGFTQFLKLVNERTEQNAKDETKEAA